MSCNDGYCNFDEQEPSEPKCPVCGGIPIITKKTLQAWVQCANCKHIATGIDEYEALKAWLRGGKNG